MLEFVIATFVAMAGLVADDPAPGLSAPFLYHGIDRPLLIEVEPPPSPDALTLVLMADDGTVLLGPVPVNAGPADLCTVLPAVSKLRRTAFLQLLHGYEPVGSALVVQPMLSRMVPRTEESVNPNGVRYTRIVGWYDELQSPVDPAVTEEELETDDGTDNADGAPAGNDDDPAAPSVTSPLAAEDEAEIERLCTGFRVYAERDVVLHTTKGRLRIALRPDQAPNTAWNFLQLCAGGFYRGVAFHRVVPMTRDGNPFVIQAGDPTGTGSGGPGYWLPIEPSGLPHDFGVISMARDVAPDSAGSQFFICLSRAGTGRLDGHYCAFGAVVDGADTIRAIADVELDLEQGGVAMGRPVDPPIIERAEVLPAPPRLPRRGRPDEPVAAEPEVPEVQEKPGRVPR